MKIKYFLLTAYFFSVSCSHNITLEYGGNLLKFDSKRDEDLIIGTKTLVKGEGLVETCLKFADIDKDGLSDYFKLIESYGLMKDSITIKKSDDLRNEYGFEFELSDKLRAGLKEGVNEFEKEVLKQLLPYIGAVIQNIKK